MTEDGTSGRRGRGDGRGAGATSRLAAGVVAALLVLALAVWVLRPAGRHAGRRPSHTDGDSDTQPQSDTEADAM